MSNNSQWKVLATIRKISQNFQDIVAEQFSVLKHFEYWRKWLENNLSLEFSPIMTTLANLSLKRIKFWVQFFDHTSFTSFTRSCFCFSCLAASLSFSRECLIWNDSKYCNTPRRITFVAINRQTHLQSFSFLHKFFRVILFLLSQTSILISFRLQSFIVLHFLHSLNRDFRLARIHLLQIAAKIQKKISFT